MGSDPLPTPATLAELQAMLPAEIRVRVRLTLTPELARQILAHNNRVTNPRDARVAELVRRITAGQWNPDGWHPGRAEAIVFSQNLRVGNGAHRLQAADLADRPITVDVARWPGQALKPGPPLPIAVPPAVTAEAVEAALKIAQRATEYGV